FILRVVWGAAMPDIRSSNQPTSPEAAESWASRWGLLLRLARQVEGLSLNELAARSGLSKGYLSKLESAHHSAANPSRATLAALARALPTTLPLIQHMAPEEGLPTARSLVGGQWGNMAQPVAELPRLAGKREDVEPGTSEGASSTSFANNWMEWEI